MSIKTQNVEIRLIITPDDELFNLFNDTKNKTGLKANSEVARMSMKIGLKEMLKPL